MKYLFSLCSLILLFSCGTSESDKKAYPTTGQIERLDPLLDQIISPNAQIEVIASGLTWAEGPLWVEEHQMLLFSDVVMNKVYKWTETEGLSVYLEPSGFTGTFTDSREKGSNGLILNQQNELVLCQHGNRQIAKMDADLANPQSNFITIVNHYEGKKFNSPNDLIFDTAGNLYFTDPPYGLSEAMMEDPKKELDFQGVFKYDTQGQLTLLTKEVSRPNGLALSPDEKTLYVANSDGEKAVWYAFPVQGDSLSQPTILYDATDLVGKEIGFPDGVKVDPQGNIFTAGPGGIWIFSADHQLLGKIKSEFWTSNCNFNADYSTLYITADDHVLRVKLK
ncbi:MAG TPA: SMP-30/gluconolactonase/LRE family protein [Saprospiraceae bacterium]|nr:SMP-30/gluconolactonase/LRE family protein [Saprospiraceae bacterium]